LGAEKVSRDEYSMRRDYDAQFDLHDEKLRITAVFSSMKYLKYFSCPYLPHTKPFQGREREGGSVGITSRFDAIIKLSTGLLLEDHRQLPWRRATATLTKSRLGKHVRCPFPGPGRGLGGPR